jgi:hypothetical protein
MDFFSKKKQGAERRVNFRTRLPSFSEIAEHRHDENFRKAECRVN